MCSYQRCTLHGLRSGSELWTMLNLLEPKEFGSYDDFVESYGDMQSAEQAQKLVEVIRPYLLRRTKDDVNLGELKG